MKVINTSTALDDEKETLAFSAMLIKYFWIPFENGKHGTYLMVD